MNAARSCARRGLPPSSANVKNQAGGAVSDIGKKDLVSSLGILQSEPERGKMSDPAE